MKTIETDILIVGGGVAGATLAAALRHQGYRIVVIEQRKGPLDTARGDHLQPFNVAAFAEWGLLDEFVRRGATKRVGHEFRTSAGETLLSLRYDELQIPHPYFLVINHELIADINLELAAQNPAYTCLRPVTARHFARDDEGHIVAVTVESENETMQIKPHLVVAADGAHSHLREWLKATADEYVYKHAMVALFGARPANLTPDDYFFRYGGKAGMLVIQQRTDGTIKVTTPIGQEGVAFWKQSSAGDRAEVLGERAHVLRDFVSDIAGFYPVKMVHCHEYVHGNTVLIGDAAHAIHPARGQGLNMGIASLPRLLNVLPAPAEIGKRATLSAALQRYQSIIKPLYDQNIARNHQAALVMESMAEESIAQLVEQEDAMIRRLHSEPEMRYQHLLEITGYPPGTSKAT